MRRLRRVVRLAFRLATADLSWYVLGIIRLLRRAVVLLLEIRWWIAGRAVLLLYQPFSVAFGRTLDDSRAALIGTTFADTVHFGTSAALLFGLIYAVDPTLIVGTQEGIAAMVQAIPATIFGVFVLALGSLFAVAQLTINAYGHRAALLIVEDRYLPRLVVRPLIVVVAALMLSGQVPQEGVEPSALLTTAFTVLALATASTIWVAATTLLATLLKYTAPMSVANVASEGAGQLLADGLTGMVRWRVPMLEEMLKIALRRGDSAAVLAALHGLRRIQEGYIEAVSANPAVKTHIVYEEDKAIPLEGWFANDYRSALLRMSEAATAIGVSTDDGDLVIQEMEDSARRFTEAGLEHETLGVIDALTLLGCSSVQVTRGFINVQVRPAGCLARTVEVAQAAGANKVAAAALASWQLVCDYYTFHLSPSLNEAGAQMIHPSWQTGIEIMGSNAPWGDAVDLIKSRSWQQHWNNQMTFGAEVVARGAELSQKVHAEFTRTGTFPTPDFLDTDGPEAQSGEADQGEDTSAGGSSEQYGGASAN